MTNNKLPSSIFSCFVNVNLIIFLYGPVDNPFFLLSLQEYVYKNMFQYVYCIRIRSGGQVTFKKQLSYFTSVTCKSNSLLLIRYPFLIVTVPLQLLVTDILNVTKYRISPILRTLFQLYRKFSMTVNFLPNFIRCSKHGRGLGLVI